MALEQHAVPTQVTSYEFRLVGDMTLKQFGWLASGIVLAIIIYSLPLPGYIRWPLVLLTFPSGALIAFVPLEGRGIDRWIIAFIKAIYSPTEYLWRQEHPIPNFFTQVSIRPLISTPTKTTQRDAAQLEEYIHTLPVMQATTALDQQESQQLDYFNQLVNSTSDSNMNSLPPNSPPPLSSKPPTPILLNDQPLEATSDIPVLESDFNPPQMSDQESTSLQEILNQSAPGPAKVDLEQLEKQVADTLKITQSTAQDISKTSPSAPQDQTSTKAAPPPPDQSSSQFSSAMAQPSVSSTLQETDTQPALPIPATFSHQLPVSPPTQANVVVGMVTDDQGKIVDNAIIEIKDEYNKPVRAFKTNKLGQFAIATALNNGIYIIEIEKQGIVFDQVSFEASGQIIPPIAIKAK